MDNKSYIEEPPEDRDPHQVESDVTKSKTKSETRDQWGHQLEFLMSCISMSVGLGNVWRFPYTAYENGGGAFLIPYIIILLLLGKPLYYLELIMGQFSSYGCIGIWNCAPALKGIGYGQMIGASCIVTYYVALMALTLRYMIASMSAQLPWAHCWTEWTDCVDATLSPTRQHSNESLAQTVWANTSYRSSAEIYFEQVTQSVNNIDNGIGRPQWALSLCLLASWVVTLACIVRGVKTSGKTAYFTAIFPYTVLITLFIRGVTLPGAVDGIIYYLQPKWHRLLEPEVWFKAITQCFFSLGISFGVIPMLASFNPFSHSIARDAAIISIIDMFTSFLAGFTIFSVLGNLAHQKNTDVTSVINSGGTELAFVTYPQALANFPAIPQLFSVLFFLMLFTLGLGTSTTLTNGIITAICDKVPRWSRPRVAAVICSIFFLIGLVYVTPGGTMILDLVDYFSGNLIIFTMAILEVIGLVWIYGVSNISRDVMTMMGQRPSLYMRFSWKFISPVILTVVFVGSLVKLNLPKQTDNSDLPVIALLIGWCLTMLAIATVVVYFVYTVHRQKQQTLFQRVRGSCRPNHRWGPRLTEHRLRWQSDQGHDNDLKSHTATTPAIGGGSNQCRAPETVTVSTPM